MTDPTTASPRDRVEDLLARLTLPEKIGLLHQWQAPVPRLDLPGFRTGTEALHGVAWLGPATVFPQAIGLASSWNPDLVRAVGAAVGDEVRAKHHADPERVGLNVWAPVVNPLRDPRWGRNEEGWSEDPWLTGRLATAYAEGLRGDHPERLRTAPTVKHFLGYNNETDRATTSSDLPPRVLYEYELPAFRAPLAAGAAVAAMASYNLVDGVPAHLSPLINDELRRWAPGEVLVVGDAGAVTNIAGVQGHLPEHVNGFAAALRAGIDSFTEDDADSTPTRERLTEALRRGLITTSDVDRAVRRVLTLRWRLGDLDPPHTDPYAATPPEVVDCPAHRELAREAARQSIVLLRNRGLLPLAPGLRVAVLGPLADTVYADWYSGTLPYAVTAYQGLTGRLPQVSTHPGADRIVLRVGDQLVGCPADAEGGPLTVGTDAAWFDVFDWGRDTVALRAVGNGRHVGADDDGTLVNDRPGPGGWVVRETFQFDPLPDGTVLLRHLATDRYVTVDGDGRLRVAGDDRQAGTAFGIDLVADGAAQAAALAADSDVAVVTLGNHPMVNGRETEDRVDLALPARQEAMLRAVHAANPRTVLVVTSSYPYALGWAQEHLPAVLWSAHGGQEHGTALADVLLGDAEPGGRLTQTWYTDAAELPDLLDYDVIGADATYLYYRGEPLYPFGHGLSYARYDYTDLRLSAASASIGEEVEVSVDVTNSGDRTGEEVVQLYTRQRRSRVKQPLRQLRDFARITLAPGERRTVTLRLRTAELGWWDADRGGPVVEDATHTVLVGRSATDVRLTGALAVRAELVGLPARLHTAGGVR
ncbi:glycoside hydrolase family 3 C-terminal domain-containing protein [Micromonospora sp. WMMD1082]|uniref:beta-glucosidase family protein n=1 Tax=Micromonospora sp. WMMD1082 TaxID=3016104 RepID=UPI0024179A36|nr:glycoside hydrolase family 3 C-terminal domain-containing protein [Micromonospora sp. WMMD1082]MDG4797744.1 glycoside hydrolase family 3 C-terminal domain-containing protein [Micromonospora sp. WMMD1082]